MAQSLAMEVAGLRAGLEGLRSTEDQVSKAFERGDHDDAVELHRVADQQRYHLAERLKVLESAGVLEHLQSILESRNAIDTAAPIGPREVHHG